MSGHVGKPAREAKVSTRGGLFAEKFMEKKTSIGVLMAVVVIAVVIAYLAASSASMANPTATSSELITTKLAEIPDAYYQAMSVSGGVAKNLSGLSFSPDGKQVALVVKETGKSSVYLDDAAGQWYDTVDLSPFAFSSDGRHYMYIAGKGNDSFVVLDGKEQQHYQNGYVDSSSIFISSSGVPAYVVIVNSKNAGDHLTEYAVFNGHAGNTYAFVEYLKISPDAQHAVYYGCKSDDNTPYSDPLSKGTGFCSFVTQDLDGSVHESDGIFFASGVSEAIYHGNIIYSPDGTLLAYTTRLGNEDSFTINGVKTFSPPGNYPEMNISGVVFSPDSKHVAYLVQGCNQNNPCPTSSFGDPTGGQWYTALDNSVAGTEYDEIKNLTFDNQGGLAYFARTGNKWSMIDGASTHAVPDNFAKFPSQITFAPDNSYLYTYTDTGGKTDLISNDKEVARGDYIAFPAFTPDGKIIYTTVASDSRSMSLVVDGVAHKHDFIQTWLSLPNSIYGPFYKFTSDGSVVYGAIDGKDIYRVVDKL